MGKFEIVTFIMESALEIGMTALITIVVVRRTSISQYNVTFWDYFAYSMAIVALIALAYAPFDIAWESSKAYKAATAYKKKVDLKKQHTLLLESQGLTVDES